MNTPKPQPATTPEYLAPLCRELQRAEFWGSLELKFMKGKLTLVRKSETLLVDGERTKPT